MIWKAFQNMQNSKKYLLNSWKMIWKNFVIFWKTVMRGLMLQNQIKNRQHNRAEAAGSNAPAQKFFHCFFHAHSYLLLISAKQRLETYSR